MSEAIGSSVQEPGKVKSFRFTALPDEMQREVASYLDLLSLKRLSLCQKSLRETMVGPEEHLLRSRNLAC